MKLLFKFMFFFSKKKKYLEALGMASPLKDQGKGRSCRSTSPSPGLLN